MAAVPAAWLAVMAGGALGAGLRHGANILAVRAGGVFGGGPFYATLGVNALGSLAMGLVLGAALTRPWLEPWRPFLTTGLLGGLTTFSTFSAEGHALLARGEIGLAVLYIALSLGLGLGGFALGFAAARAF